jgi:hypothetical protein
MIAPLAGVLARRAENAGTGPVPYISTDQRESRRRGGSMRPDVQLKKSSEVVIPMNGVTGKPVP